MVKIKIVLKETMKNKCVTQKQLEEMTGIGQARISKLNDPSREEVNLIMLGKIAEALEITDISDLMQIEVED